MPLISEQLPNLMNGVSQQAFTLRMSSQAERQVNGLSSLVSGNVKRPPTKHLSKIHSGSAAGAHIHTINRDATEQYVVFTENRSIRVFDLDGNEKAVTYPNGTDYLATENPSEDFRAVTVADYTFFVNRKVEVETLPDRSPQNSNAALLFVKEGAYDTTYTVTVDNSVAAEHTTPEATGGNKITIEEIVTALVEDLTNNIGNLFEIAAKGPVIYIKRTNNADFQLEFADDDGGSKVDVIRRNIQRFTDLPVVGRDGFVISVTGDEGSTFDEYYLKFRPDNEGQLFDDGVWEETVAPDIEYRLNPSTLPHTLVRMADGSFEFREEVWGDRVAGDDASAPFPSFVGNKISDIYFDRRRLCMLSGDNVTMSKRGYFFNFMPDTVLQVLDDGRIDVSTTGAKVASLAYAAPFNGKIILFSDQAQYAIDADFLLASNPPAVEEISNYQSQGRCAPAASGRTLFFAVSRGDWAGMLEYYVIGDTDTTDAADITEHVPRYVPSPVTHIAASPTSNIVMALSATKQNSLWVYKHHWQGNKKLQSSWSEWTFTSTASIQNIDFVGDTCVLVVDYPDGVYLEALDISEGQYDDGEEFVYRLDRRLPEERLGTGTYDIRTDETTFSLPYNLNGDTLAGATRYAAGTSNTPQGQGLQITGGADTPEGHVFKVRGDYTNTKFYVGLRYSHVYTFSQAVLRTSSGTGGVATALAGRLQLKRWHVHLEDTGYFRAEVLPYGRTKPYVREFTGTTLGSVDATVGGIPVLNGPVSFRVNSRSDRVQITLVNDSFLPSAFTAAEWEGRYSRNTSRT